jgi:ferredoxin
MTVAFTATRSAEPSVRAARLLRPLDTALRSADASLARALPEPMNPLAWLGALANLCLLMAIATGVLLLFWYVPSVHRAQESVAGMAAAPWTAELCRSLHRYSSDACMALVLLHAAKIFFARRFTGARWLAWVTGVVALAIVWFLGWTGYWLVWDERGQLVALGTARLLDAVPIFVDPLSRSFLTDATINSLLFFVVFFAHMLVPLLLAIAIWLHIARLRRARFLPGRGMALWSTFVLVAVSLLWPADTAAKAHMARVPGELAIDWWYLAPLVLTDRLGGAMLWLLVLGGGAIALAVPWWMRRGRPAPATVDVSRCNACTNCSQDCPYGAIAMVPRTDGKDRPAQAQVDPALCVGCGICAGSCDSIGIGLDWLPVRNERDRVGRRRWRVRAARSRAGRLGRARVDESRAADRGAARVRVARGRTRANGRSRCVGGAAGHGVRARAGRERTVARLRRASRECPRLRIPRAVRRRRCGPTSSATSTRGASLASAHRSIWSSAADCSALRCSGSASRSSPPVVRAFRCRRSACSGSTQARWCSSIRSTWHRARPTTRRPFSCRCSWPWSAMRWRSRR